MNKTHLPGRGCTCGASSEADCGCVGVDWRSSREVELEGLLVQSEARAQILYDVLEELFESGDEDAIAQAAYALNDYKSKYNPERTV